MLIITTGMPGSGKEELLKMLKRTGFSIARMGDTVRSFAEREGVGKDDAGVGDFASNERIKKGPQIWAERTLNNIEDRTKDLEVNAVIDGCRSLEEIDHYRTHHEGKIVIIAVHASPKTRYDRLSRRGRSDSPEDYAQFQDRDRRELEWGIGSVIAIADEMIINEGTLGQFRTYASRVLGRVIDI